MKASELDKRFDDGEDISKYLDLSKARKPEQEQKRVKVDFPLWMINLLDKESKRLGVPRQSIIKVWVAERLEKNNLMVLDSNKTHHIDLFLSCAIHRMAGRTLKTAPPSPIIQSHSPLSKAHPTASSRP